MIPDLVLDTNAVLDWLVFRHPASQALADSILAGQVRWVVTAAVRDELAHVLGRGVVDRWQPDLPQLWATWERHAHVVATPDALPLHRPRCSDPDDQKFLDLALTIGAQWLITRDRALLKVARRVRQQGLSIVTPERFSLPFAIQHAS